jgi:hypothetical protein
MNPHQLRRFLDVPPHPMEFSEEPFGGNFQNFEDLRRTLVEPHVFRV